MLGLMKDYPRMLYRPGKGPSEVWEELVDTLIVQSASEEMLAVRDGWLREPDKACQRAKRRRQLGAKFRWLAGHWQFWVTSAIALAGVVLSYLARK